MDMGILTHQRIILLIDDKVSQENSVYRLKQIDNNGQFEYSKKVEVSFMNTE